VNGTGDREETQLEQGDEPRRATRLELSHSLCPSSSQRLGLHGEGPRCGGRMSTMYHPWLFNERNEFQRLAGVLAGPGGVDVHSETEEFLLRATGVRLAQDRIADLKLETERKFRRHRGQLRLDRDPVQCWSPAIVDLIGQITFSVGQLRRMQDLQVSILARIQGLKGVPQSLKDAVRDLERYGFNPAVARTLVAYWSSGGAALKGYRDIDTHFFAIASHAVMYHSLGESLKVYLPDDVGQKSRRKAAFTQGIDALDFLTTAYHDLERVFDRCLEVLGIAPLEIPLVTRLRAGEPARAEATLAVSVATTSAIETRFDPVAQTLRSQVVDLPPNDPRDCPVSLSAIVDELRHKLSGADDLVANDLHYLGAPEVMVSVYGFEVGGPWKGWLWRLDHCELSYFVLAIAEKCGWLFWQKITPGVDQEEMLARLFHRAFLRRDRDTPRPPGSLP